MNPTIHEKEGALIGIIKNRPTGLVMMWLFLSFIMIYYGIFSKGSYWFLLIIGAINLFSSLFVLLKVKQYTAIQVYQDKLILTDHKELGHEIRIGNEEIKNWEIENREGSSLILDLMNGDQISYRVTQGGKVNRLLMKTIGSKEKNEREMEQFRKKNDEAFIGISDIRRKIRKGKDQDEKKHKLT